MVAWINTHAYPISLLPRDIRCRYNMTPLSGFVQALPWNASGAYYTSAGLWRSPSNFRILTDAEHTGGYNSEQQHGRGGGSLPSLSCLSMPPYHSEKGGPKG